jgi:hypothetical protein
MNWSPICSQREVTKSVRSYKQMQRADGCLGMHGSREIHSVLLLPDEMYLVRVGFREGFREGWAPSRKLTEGRTESAGSVPLVNVDSAPLA